MHDWYEERNKALAEAKRLKARLAECREKLAAAEAAIRGVEYFNSYGMAQCPFCRAVLPYSHTVDCITQQPMTALDAVLEQAQIEVLDMIAQHRFEDIKGGQKLLAAAEAVSIEWGTALEQARTEGAVEALADLAVGNIKGDAVLAYEDHSVEAWIVSKTWYEQELTDAKAEGVAEERERCINIISEWEQFAIDSMRYCEGDDDRVARYRAGSDALKAVMKQLGMSAESTAESMNLSARQAYEIGKEAGFEDGKREGYAIGKESGTAEERERCAKKAMATFNPKQPEDADYDWGYNDAKRDIAHAIRQGTEATVRE